MLARKALFMLIAVYLISTSFASPIRNFFRKNNNVQGNEQGNQQGLEQSGSSSSANVDQSLRSRLKNKIKKVICKMNGHPCASKIELIKPFDPKLHGGRIVAYIKNEQTSYFHRTAPQFREKILDSFEPFVRTADNEIHRFPPNMNDDIYDTSIREGYVFGGSKKNIIKQIAGFQVSKDLSYAIYKFKNTALAPILMGSENFRLFKYPDGRHMIPQVDSKSCTYSTTAMFLMDKGYIGAEDAMKIGSPSYHSRISIEQVENNIINYSKKKPLVLIWMRRQFSLDSIYAALENNIKKYGSAIVEYAGHSVIWDSITRKNGEWIVEVRDPFHGELSIMKARDAILKSPKDLYTEIEQIDAIFLTSNPNAQQKNSRLGAMKNYFKS